MWTRRKFITQSLLTSGSIIIGSKISKAAELFSQEKRLTILHTNDTHSRIDPFPMDGSKLQGQGGVAARAHLIDTIRHKEKNVLLFDSGDIFQGTPYFNLFNGEPEIKAMSAMGYDGVTIGNHDFDAGLQNLSLQVQQHARFPVIISNYDFTGTVMEHHHQPYKIFNKGDLKIGVIGLGIKLQGLVRDELFLITKYLDPVQKANEYAAVLKAKKCDLIICLSHLGYSYTDNKVSDTILAKESEDIDVIIGGHTHTFLDAPVVIKNKRGKDVIINQVGWGGVRLGRLDFSLESTGKKLISANSIAVIKKTDN